MTHKTTKTIADLNINWTFFDGDYWTNTIVETNGYRKFCELNPEIHKIKITPNSNYTFIFENKQFRCGSYDFETLGEYFVHLNQAFWFKFKKQINLKKFERISDTKYIIHGK